MKLEIVADASGLPLGAAAAAANVTEYDLAMPALADIPVPIPEGTAVIADRGHDSDDLRDAIEANGQTPVIPHRRSRVRPSRNDGRRLRRYRHRWIVERTNAWLHSYRGLAVRWAHRAFMYVGLVYTAFIAIAIKRF